MVDRTVKVSLVATAAGYVSEMQRASRETTKFSNEAQKKLAAQGAAFTSLGTSVAKMGVLAAAGLAITIAKFAQFDQAMSQVQAAAQASVGDLALLRDAAIDAGAKTQYSATEAANAIEELSKAGLSAQQVIGGGLSGALTLAAAGGIDVAEAAGYAAVAMKQFGLEGSQLPHVADLFAAGAGKAVGDVSDLAQALGQAGLVANGAGQSIEDTTGVLAAFADAGLLGSDAGTSLKSAIIALQAPTSTSQKLMEQYNLSFYDGAGNMLSYSQIAGQLTSNLGTLTAEERNATLAKIFGNDALRSANVLYEQGAAGIQKYIDQTNDSGYAAKVAADRLNNLSGDIEKLGGSFDTALIQAGSGANDTLRQLTQNLTVLVDAVGGLPEPVTNAGLALGTAATATALLGGAALVGLPKIQAFKVSLKDAGISGKQAATGFGLAGGAISLATFALSAYLSSQAGAAAEVDELTASLDQNTGAFQENSRSIVANRITSDDDLIENAKKYGIALDDLTDAALGTPGAIDRVRAAWQASKDAGVGAGSFGATSGFAFFENRLGRLAESTEKSRQKFIDQKEAMGDADATAEGTTGTMESLTDSFGGQTDALADLVTALSDYNDEAFKSANSGIALEQSIDDVAERLHAITAGTEGYSATLDTNTQAGRDNMKALLDLAGNANSAAADILAVKGSSDEAAAALERGRKKFIAAAVDMGKTEQAAADLWAEYGAAPDAVVTEVKAAGLDEASQTVDRWIRSQEQKSAGIKIKTIETKSGSGGGGGSGGGKASGGPISGPGTGTSDDVPIMASDGEHMITAAEVRKAGGHGAVYAARRRLMSTGRLALANGGAVTSTRPNFAGAGSVADARAQAAEAARAAREERAARIAQQVIDEFLDGVKKASEAQEDAANAQKVAAEAAADAADAAAEAAQKAADAIKTIADQFTEIDLSGLTEDVQTFTRVLNADGSTSIFGSSRAGSPTAEGINAFFADQSAGNQRFAGKLAQLAGRIPVGLLAYLTSLGVEKGEPYADALLAASSSTLSSIAANYNSAQAGANTIGSTVAPALSGFGALGSFSNGLNPFLSRTPSSQYATASAGPTTSVSITQIYQGTSTDSQRRNDALSFAKVATL